MSTVLFEEPFATVPGSSPNDQPGHSEMKVLSCIIRPESLEAVKTALDQLQVVGGMTITDVRGFGRQKGQVEHYRGGEYTIRFIAKVRVDVVVRTEDADRVVAAVSNAVRTGRVGDGKIFVLDVRSAMRVRTGDRGVLAL